MIASAIWGIAALLIVVGVSAVVSSWRFGRGVEREVRNMWRSIPDVVPVQVAQIERLPDPVRRYLHKALAERPISVRTLRVQHGGTFRPKLDGAWLPIRGQQYFRADAPAFVWWGRVGIMPGVWIDARDRSVDGVGNMLVSMESAFTLADSKGPDLDQGALLRLLGEMVWMPPSFLQERVHWTAIDATHAKADFELSGRHVSGTFELGDDDLPRSFSAQRFRDAGDGKPAVLSTFTGEMSDYRKVDGMLVPHRLVGNWDIDGKRIPYARFDVQRIEYDVIDTF